MKPRLFLPWIATVAMLAVVPSAPAQQVRITVGGEYSSARSLTPAARIMLRNRYFVHSDGYANLYGFNQRDITVSAQFAPVLDVSFEWPRFAVDLRASYAPGHHESKTQIIRLFNRNFWPLYDVRYIGGAPHYYTGDLRYGDLRLRGLWPVYRADRLSVQAGVGVFFRRALFQQRSRTTSYGPVTVLGVGYGIWDNHVTLGSDAYANLLAGGPTLQVSYKANKLDTFTAWVSWNVGKYWFGARFIDIDDIWFRSDQLHHWILNGGFSYAQCAEIAAFPELAVAWRYTINKVLRFAVLATQTVEPGLPGLVAYAWSMDSIGFERGKLTPTTRLSAGIAVNVP